MHLFLSHVSDVVISSDLSVDANVTINKRVLEAMAADAVYVNENATLLAHSVFAGEKCLFR